MLKFLFFSIFLPFLIVFVECSGRRRSKSLGLTNTPIFENQTSREELSYPYLNVYYDFDSKDWNRLREDNLKLINMRKRLSRLKRELTSDKDRINRFMDIERNLAIDARGKLFQKALSKNVLLSKQVKKRLEPMRLFDQVTNDLPEEQTYFYQPQ